MQTLQKGPSPLPYLDYSVIKNAFDSGRFKVFSDYSELKRADCVSICVPTPLRKTREPDLSFIVQATQKLKDHLREGQLIVLESTTYPGTTEELVKPILEESGFVTGKDFFLAFSPERIDPGNKNYDLPNTPKVVGGMTSQCLELAGLLYGKVCEKIVPVSSAAAAEMVKLLENTYRAVNIGLVNEIAVMANRLQLDVWEIIEAASTKPFGFHKFYPGPGLGGHCIPVDPQFLSWKLKTLNYHTRFIQLAEEVNSSMPFIVMERITEALNSHFKSVNGSKILILGLSYKKDVGDLRESPALEVWKLLAEKGAFLSYIDPFAQQFFFQEKVIYGMDVNSVPISEFDCVVVLTDHTHLPYERYFQEAKLVVDTRNVTKQHRDKSKFFKL
ncbi:MAG: nucleotide sugar dehydrogenase [Deltaproteobacteria bacterium]|nr:nucleotide sugar dehydrogenase [Deltaproteobacteria bacterium]